MPCLDARRITMVLAALILLTCPLLVRADSAKPEGYPTGAMVRLDYLYLEDATQEEYYAGFTFAYDTDGKWFNPRAGIRLRADDGQIRAYFAGNDFIITRRLSAGARLTHAEYGDWETAINSLCGYVTYRRWWFRVGLGLGYAAVILEGPYQNPIEFGTEMPETRFLYDLSIRPHYKDFELDVGLKNFDDFDVNGFDDNGYHLEPIWHVTDNTAVSAKYEKRFAGVFINMINVSSESWTVSVEHRFD